MTVRRMKTYSGAQGYVYEYYFVGKRPALANDPEAPAMEFIFDVTSDRKLTYSVSVFLPQEPLNSWRHITGGCSTTPSSTQRSRCGYSERLMNWKT